MPASRWIVPTWPMVKCDGHVFAKSSFDAALMQAVTAANNNIPTESVDNRDLQIDGICLEDGTKVSMTQDDVNDYLNRYGVLGANRLDTWNAWGNNTAAYPDSSDPIDRWIKSVLTLNYLENKFKREYLSKIGRSATYKLVESVVTEYNMFLNSLTPNYIAGAEIVFDRAENPLDKVRVGHFKFRTLYADYAPTEVIENEFEYVAGILDSVFGGEES